MDRDRRTLMLAAASAAAVSAVRSTAAFAASPASFPAHFLWGAATAGHQVEGNNVSSDVWLAENVSPTLFTERSGDADNSFELWERDLDLVRQIGLNAYRLSLEWARIEPDPACFSQAMIDHYGRIIEGCHARGIVPVVSFNHVATPRWFAAQGGWTNPDSPGLFARFCGKAAAALADGIGYATTLNEPNALAMLADFFPPEMFAASKAMNEAAGRACGSSNFRLASFPEAADIPQMHETLLTAHKLGKAAIKAARSALPVGVTLAISDDQAVGPNSVRDAKRKAYYGAWLDAAKADDFVAVQNYSRTLWGDKGRLPPPADAPKNGMGQDIYPPSLAHAVRYAHEMTGRPVLITEHGLDTDDDRQRAAFIPAALDDLQKVIAGGVPVRGYLHWSLLDNFEWTMGYKHHFGLASVDRTTFERTLKPSAAVFGRIARRNAV